MKPLFLVLSCLLIAGQVQAQVNMNRARAQARRAVRPPSVVPQPSGTQQPAGTPQSSVTPQMKPVDPVLEATLKNSADLGSNFRAISAAADKNAAAEQRVSLLNNLSAAGNGTKASTARVNKLANDFISELPGQNKISGVSQKLGRDVHALFNSSHLSAVQQEQLLGEVKKLFSDAGVSGPGVDKIDDDLKTIVSETK